MANDGRVYSEEEFALILRQAAELASTQEQVTLSSGGMTLAEMQSVASQVGFDPALVERAARMVTARRTASPLDRVLGGPLRHADTAHFPVRIDQRTAARLLSAVRISGALAGHTDVGHSSALGMTWHDGGELESLGVTARRDGDGAAVSVSVDRRGTLGIVAAASAVTSFFVLLFASSALYPESAALGIGGAIGGVGGIAAIARGYWASSTRRVRERMREAMEAIGDTLQSHEAEASPAGVDADEPSLEHQA